MEIKNYLNLKKTVLEMNKLNDKIGLLEWNKEDGPKFESVEEMKDFITRVSSNEFNYLFPNEKVVEDKGNSIIDSFEYTIENIFFYIYTFKKNNEYITYLSVKNIDESDFLNNLCGKKNTSKEAAHAYLEKLKDEIVNNNLDTVLDSLTINAEKLVKNLKIKLEKLASEN